MSTVTTVGSATMALVWLVASAGAPSPSNDLTQVVIEWAPFSLAEGVEEAEMLAAADAVQERFLNQQEGFLRRELLRASDREWVDLVYWENRQAADRAAENVVNSEACHAYFALMQGADPDNPSAGVQHFERRKIYSQGSE